MPTEHVFNSLYEPNPITTEILSKFDSMIIHHPKFAEALEEILSYIELGSPQQILLVIGPTGVGKSTLVNVVYKKIFDQCKNLNEQPPIKISINPPEGSTFGFRAFYIQLLRELDEPLPDYKMAPDDRLKKLAENPGGRISRSSSEVRLDLDTALQSKKCPVMLLDEANHFGRSASKEMRTVQMDIAKSLAEVTQTKIVGFGTPEALRLMHLNSQLSRRIVQLDFSQYESNELGEFFLTYKSICNGLKLPVAVDHSHKNYLFENSLGLIGHLSSWMREATKKAIREKSKIVTIEHFKKAQPKKITNQLIKTNLLEYKIIKSDIENELEQKIERLKTKIASSTKPGRRNPTMRDTSGGIIQ